MASSRRLQVELALKIGLVALCNAACKTLFGVLMGMEEEEGKSKKEEGVE